MNKNQIYPEKITKPIQLLGAWLVGLLAIDASFLYAATKLDVNSWQSGLLTVAAIVNVPIFIIALFVLQTRFRPELQEDAYYSAYLNNRTNELMKIPKKEQFYDSIEKRLDQIELLMVSKDSIQRVTPLSELSYGVNIHLNNQDRIEAELSKIGVQAVREFGQDSKCPEELKVAISHRLSLNIRNQILALSNKLGFEYYSLIEPWEEIKEDVLFGAYGETEGKIAGIAT
ncbi:MAG: hypothetical protein Q8K97_00035 [Pseudohongiella sp.]|nr:hypothetical protein [Pseudohongiella sp.]